MVTPERFRRRQRIEGVALLILGVLTIILAIYFRAQDTAQRECVADKFSELARVLQIRGDLQQRDANSQARVILRVAKADDPSEVRSALDLYVSEQADIEAERARHPVPPFPAGSCE